MIALLWLLACGGTSQSEVDRTPEPIGLSECAVCGMVVGEQPAPRGQVLHRDGSHRFTCSIGDLRAYVQAPSPLGEPVEVWVEALPPELGTVVTDTPMEWIDADQAHFVFGVDRPAVMGLPALVYADAAAAAGAAAELETTPVSWDAVRTTPFDEIPTGGKR